jgi:hypothetical protein
MSRATREQRSVYMELRTCTVVPHLYNLRAKSTANKPAMPPPKGTPRRGRVPPGFADFLGTLFEARVAARPSASWLDLSFV